jgi:GTP-binding protein HflX
VDASAPAALDQAQTVEEVLAELGAGSKPTVLALNKTDLLGPASLRRVATAFGERYPRVVSVSALRRIGLDRMGQAIDDASDSEMVALELLVPYGREGVLNELRQVGGVERTEYTERGTLARGRAPRQVVHRFEEYLVS